MRAAKRIIKMGNHRGKGTVCPPLFKHIKIRYKRYHSSCKVRVLIFLFSFSARYSDNGGQVRGRRREDLPHLQRHGAGPAARRPRLVPGWRKVADKRIKGCVHPQVVHTVDWHHLQHPGDQERSPQGRRLLRVSHVQPGRHQLPGQRPQR